MDTFPKCTLIQDRVLVAVYLDTNDALAES